MGQAVIFVEEQYTPLPWEDHRREKTAGSYPISRLCIMIRNPETRQHLMEQATNQGKPVEGTYSEWQSSWAWDMYGTQLRKVATILAPRVKNVFLFFEDVDLGCLDAPIPCPDRWLFSYGQVPYILHMCERVSREAFISYPWPQWSKFRNGSALLFESEDCLPYQQHLIRSLEVANYHEVRRLLHSARFDPELLTSLVESGAVYVHVGGFVEMPESADPWYFVPRANLSEQVLSSVISELISSGLIVFLSRYLPDYYLWQELGELPRDAVRIERRF